MAAPPAIDPREGLRPLFERAGIDDNFYHRYKERLLDKGVGNAGDLLEEVALKGIASLGIHERQAEKLRRALLGRRGWEDAAAVLASFGGLSLDDTPAGVAAGDQAAGGAASAPALDGMAVDGGYASADEDAGPAAGWPAAASGSKMEPGCSHSGAGTSAAAEGGEGAVTGGEGCSGTRTPEAESGAREARAAVVGGTRFKSGSQWWRNLSAARRRRRGRRATCPRSPLMTLDVSTYARPPAYMRPSSSRTAPALRPAFLVRPRG